jgi:diguanylate cyclase (GGDEF)-like protein/PAS domain S-box-containing protein
MTLSPSLFGVALIVLFAWKVAAEVSRRRRAERQLRVTDERYGTLLKNVPVGLFRDRVFPDAARTMANPALAQMFGYDSVEEFMGTNPDGFFVDPAARDEWTWKVFHEGKPRGLELLLKRKDGTLFWAALTAELIRDAVSEAICIDGIVEDITSRKLAQEDLAAANRELTTLSTTDSLTGLSNRQKILVGLEVELERGRRLGHRLSVILIDIDHLKPINDLYGYVTGDAILAEVGRRLRESCRPYDLVGRYGSEEFLVVLPEVAVEAAAAAAERIRQRIGEETCRLESGPVVCVSASLGVAESSDDPSERAADLLALADLALSQAKEEGRNRVCLAPSPASFQSSPA